MRVSKKAPDHLGNPEWHIQIKAEQTVELGTGERGGDYKAVDRSLEIELTPQDITALFNFVLKNKLLAFSAKS